MSVERKLADTWIRERLARVRAAKGLSQREAVTVTGVSERTITRLEGIGVPYDKRAGIDYDTLADVCAGYGLSEYETAQLQELRRLSSIAGWWSTHTHSALVNEVYAEHCEIEEIATAIHGYSLGVLDGLLQTPEYADFVQRLTPEVDHPDERAALRLERKRRFLSSGIHAKMVVDESVLRRYWRHGDMVSEQIAHLRDLSSQKGIEIRYLPFEAEALVSVNFQIHWTPYQQVVCLDGTGTERHQFSTSSIQRYNRWHEKLWSLAQPIHEVKVAP